MIKEEIRNSFLKLRKNLSQKDYKRLNSSVLEQFLSSFNLEGLTVHTFLPIKKQKEVDTYQIIENYLFKNVNWVVSKSNFKDLTLTNYLFEGVSQIEVNDLGIPEPMNGQKIDESTIDIILVPMIAFDLHGYRVGYGKGFYDRFLSKCQGRSQFIGLSFYDPIERIDDVGEHDIPLNNVVTPNKVYTF